VVLMRDLADDSSRNGAPRSHLRNDKGISPVVQSIRKTIPQSYATSVFMLRDTRRRQHLPFRGTMTNTDIVRAFLSRNPGLWFCDSCIGKGTGIRTANQVPACQTSCLSLFAILQVRGNDMQQMWRETSLHEGDDSQRSQSNTSAATAVLP
jgi:hypothetical protein